MNSLDLQQLTKAMMAGSITLMVVGLFFCAAFMALWIYPLIHCLKYRNDKDRVVWVLVTLLGGPLGGIIYLCVGRLPVVLPPLDPLDLPDPPAGLTPPSPFFQKVSKTPLDHAAMHDEKLRAKAMSDAIWNEVKARRSSNR